MLQANQELFPIYMTGALTSRQRDILSLEDFEPLTAEERDEQKAEVYFCFLETHDLLREIWPGVKITDNKVFDYMMTNQMVDGRIAQYSKVMLYAIIKAYGKQDQISLLK